MVDEEIEDVVLLAEDDDQRDSLLGETLGFAVVDSGCTKTVCGDLWLNTYLDSLSQRDRKSVHSESALCQFRFGAGKVYPSSRLVHIPVYIGSSSATLSAHVVSCNVPLLLSRNSLKKANATLDFTEDSLKIFGENISLTITKSGHYCLPLSRTMDNPHSPSVRKVLFATPIDVTDQPGEQWKKIAKLHKQFAHPSSERLIKLIRNAGIIDKSVGGIVDDVTTSCDVCKRFKKAPPRPAVGFPLATVFNETVALDLKVFRSGYMLHMIDHATRYSQACFIRNKHSATIVKALLKFWISIFGSPAQFLSDNGGEFVNDEFNELAEKFNITVLTTAAVSPWSNGLCEKHNGILGDMIQKTMSDGISDLELAIHWCVAAKNSLLNVYGFCPNQLVFGYNPAYPAVHADRPPAQNQSTVSEHIAKNLQALHAARKSFVKQESCEKLRRALSRKTRNIPHFVNGDSVYFKRNDSGVWHGPAKVLGKDAQQYLLKHGGLYVRVHPCRMQLTTEDDTGTGLSHKPNSNPVNNDNTAADSDSDEPGMTAPAALAMPLPHAEVHQPNPEPNPESDVIPAPNPNPEADVGPTPDVQPDMNPEEPDQHVINPKPPLALRRLANFNTSPPRPTQQPTEDVFYTDNSARFESAKHEELQTWRDMDVFEELLHVTSFS